MGGLGVCRRGRSHLDRRESPLPHEGKFYGDEAFALPSPRAHIPMNAFRLKSTAAKAALGALLGFGLVGEISAQSVSTTPVGAMTVTINANADQRFGVALLRPALFQGAVSGQPTTTVSATSTIPSLGSEAKYIKFTSGAAEGLWFQVVSYTTSSITVAENIQTFGAAAGDKFEVRPFWTLATLLPNGGGVPVSSDVFNPKGYVLMYNAQAVGINLSASSGFFYHDGTQGPAGWYKADGSYALANDTVVSPETSLIIRNLSAQVATTTNVGDVPVAKIANTVVARVAGRQDNLVFNPYPTAFTLANSGLVSSQAVRPSSDVFNPVDMVLVYSGNSTGKNAAAIAGYFYHDGTQGPAGWYSSDGSFTVSDSVQIAPGAAITIRKAAGQSAAVEWAPALPYTL